MFLLIFLHTDGTHEKVFHIVFHKQDNSAIALGKLSQIERKRQQIFSLSRFSSFDPFWQLGAWVTPEYTVLAGAHLRRAHRVLLDG